jgi:hypothetical protein
MEELPLRIVVRGPPPGVVVRLQRRAEELVAPSQRTAETLAFDGRDNPTRPGIGGRR